MGLGRCVVKKQAWVKSKRQTKNKAVIISPSRQSQKGQGKNEVKKQAKVQKHRSAKTGNSTKGQRQKAESNNETMVKNLQQITLGKNAQYVREEAIPRKELN